MVGRQEQKLQSAFPGFLNATGGGTRKSWKARQTQAERAAADFFGLSPGQSMKSYHTFRKYRSYFCQGIIIHRGISFANSYLWSVRSFLKSVSFLAENLRGGKVFLEGKKKICTHNNFQPLLQTAVSLTYFFNYYTGQAHWNKKGSSD